MKTHVLVLGRFVDAAMSELAEQFRVHHFLGLPDGPNGLGAETAAAIRGILQEPNRRVSRALIESLPKLEIIACCGMGLDAIDLVAAKERGIAVTNTPNLLGDEVADLAMALMLASTRQVVLADRFVREARWPTDVMPIGRTVKGKTMGILGLGQIGSAIAVRATAFGMRVLYNGPHRKPQVPYVFVEQVLDMARQSDVFVVACKGGPQTQNLVSAPVLEAIGPQGTLVNISRGSVVDEPAMIRGLRSGQLGFAALDVFHNEPHVSAELLALPNVIVAPHMGSATLETRMAMAKCAIDNLKAKFAGQPLPSPIAWP